MNTNEYKIKTRALPLVISQTLQLFILIPHPTSYISLSRLLLSFVLNHPVFFCTLLLNLFHIWLPTHIFNSNYYKTLFCFILMQFIHHHHPRCLLYHPLDLIVERVQKLRCPMYCAETATAATTVCMLVPWVLCFAKLKKDLPP